MKTIPTQKDPQLPHSACKIHVRINDEDLVMALKKAQFHALGVSGVKRFKAYVMAPRDWWSNDAEINELLAAVNDPNLTTTINSTPVAFLRINE